MFACAFAFSTTQKHEPVQADPGEITVVFDLSPFKHQDNTLYVTTMLLGGMFGYYRPHDLHWLGHPTHEFAGFNLLLGNGGYKFLANNDEAEWFYYAISQNDIVTLPTGGTGVYLKAVWNEFVVSVTYDFNGGCAPLGGPFWIYSDLRSHDLGDSFWYYSGVQNDGYNLVGWADDPINPTFWYDENFIFTTPVALTVYAIWIDKPAVIYVHGLGGGGDNNRVYYPAGTVLKAPYYGHEFITIGSHGSHVQIGWSLLGINNTILTEDVVVNQSIFLYVVWQQVARVVYYEFNSFDNVKYFPTGTVLTAPHYGWGGNYKDEEKRFQTGWALAGARLTESITLTENILLDPFWTDKVQIAFLPRTGNHAFETRYIKPGEPIGQFPSVTYQGQQPLSWMLIFPLGLDCGIEKITPAYVPTQAHMDLNPTRAIVIRPLWSEWVTITFDFRGGTGTFDKLYILPQSGRFYPTSYKPTKENDTFFAWARTPELTAPLYLPQIVMENITLHAMWDSDGYEPPTLGDVITGAGETLLSAIAGVFGIDSKALEKFWNDLETVVTDVAGFLQKWGWVILVVLGLIVLVVLFSTFRWLFDLLLLVLKAAWWLVSLPFVLIFRLIKSKRK